MMSITINQLGIILNIGAVNGNYTCPPFITLENFTRMKCINQADHLNPESWVEVEPEEEPS